MVFSLQPWRILLLLAGILVLSACEQATEKAERKYQRAVSLYGEQETEKALVELRGVFDLNGEHYDARLLYAQIQEEIGRPQQAFQHYALLAELFPRTLEPRVSLARIAVSAGDWSVAERHIDVAVELGEEDPILESLLLAREYHEQEGEDLSPEVLSDLKERARQLLETDQELLLARGVLIDVFLKLGEPYKALEELDIAISYEPTSQRLYEFKLRLLGGLEEREELGEHLRLMVEQFPDSPEYRLLLVQWYLSQDDIQSADDFLLSLVEANPDENDHKLTYVQFLIEVKSTELALAQLEEFIQADEDAFVFQTLRASIEFDRGNTEVAIAQMRDLLTVDADVSEIHNMKVTLARMLLLTSPDEAYSLVDEVLMEDSAHVAALKLHADRLIDEDLVGDAVLALRTALDQAPFDPDIRTLLARAHGREGNRSLIGENLALAVQNSNSAVAESIRYTRFLIAEEKYLAARDVVLQSLRRNPSQLALLRALSEIYLGLSDYQKAEQVASALHSIGTEEAIVLANAVQATVFQRLQRTDESLALLRGMMGSEETSLVAQAAIIRTHLASGEIVAARTFMDEVLAGAPLDRGARFLNGALLIVEGNVDAASEVYRTLLDEDPTQEVVWRAYVAALSRLGQTDDAILALDEALAALPNAQNLWWLKASFEEQNGNFEGAIAIYEEMYERDSNSAVVANNLASLITTHRTGQEDLERAYLIARRLRGSTIPAFQDTYGWIAFRMGNLSEALENLALAAAALPNDGVVQEHFGRALFSDGNYVEAADQFRLALALLPETMAERRAGVQEALSQAETLSSQN